MQSYWSNCFSCQTCQDFNTSEELKKISLCVIHNQACSVTINISSKTPQHFWLTKLKLQYKSPVNFLSSHYTLLYPDSNLNSLERSSKPMVDAGLRPLDIRLVCKDNLHVSEVFKSSYTDWHMTLGINRRRIFCHNFYISFPLGISFSWINHTECLCTAEIADTVTLLFRAIRILFFKRKLKLELFHQALTVSVAFVKWGGGALRNHTLVPIPVVF